MSKKRTPKAASKPTATVGKRYSAKRYHVQGFGIVEVGQEITPEILKLWKGTTPPQSNE